jgi:hypothetical protein
MKLRRRKGTHTSSLLLIDIPAIIKSGERNKNRMTTLGLSYFSIYGKDKKQSKRAKMKDKKKKSHWDKNDA